MVLDLASETVTDVVENSGEGLSSAGVWALIRRMHARALVVSLFLFSCGRTDLPLQAPIARLSPPTQTVFVGELATWDARASEDPEGQPLKYFWRVLSQPLGTFASLDGLGTATIELRPDVPGDWELELIVTAEQRSSRSSVARLHVDSPLNRSPRALAKGPAVIELGAEVLLDGRDSRDPDGDPLTFSWQLVSAPAGSTIATRGNDATQRTTPDLPGAYLWELEVSDSRGGRSTAQVSFLATRTLDAGFEPDAGQVVPLEPGPDVLLPTELHVLGTVYEAGGVCNGMVLSRLATPNVASAGFICDVVDSPMAIHPLTGRLLRLYRNRNELREYRCDVCAWTRGAAYPLSPLSNDPLLTTPCGSGELSDFRVAPDGRMAYRCDGVWLNEGGTPLSLAGNLLALGAGGWALTTSSVENLAAGTRFPIGGLRLFGADVRAIRWNAPSSFFVVVSTLGTQELWLVSTLDGQATRRGTYPPLAGGFGASALDPEGRLYQQARDEADPLLDVVVRREVGGASTLVYSEASAPLLRLNGSRLLTGP